MLVCCQQYETSRELKQRRRQRQRERQNAIGLDWQNNNFASASRFFVHFFTITTLLRRENAYVHRFCGGRKTPTCFFFS